MNSITKKKIYYAHNPDGSIQVYNNINDMLDKLDEINSNQPFINVGALKRCTGGDSYKVNLNKNVKNNEGN